jgi:hypothetical protein
MQAFIAEKKRRWILALPNPGMAAYVRAHYENQKGGHGSWGPVVSAIIP